MRVAFDSTAFDFIFGSWFSILVDRLTLLGCRGACQQHWSCGEAAKFPVQGCQGQRLGPECAQQGQGAGKLCAEP